MYFLDGYVRPSEQQEAPPPIPSCTAETISTGEYIFYHPDEAGYYRWVHQRWFSSMYDVRKDKEDGYHAVLFVPPVDLKILDIHPFFCSEIRIGSILLRR